MKFLSPEVTLYLYNKSTIWPHMEYCCHIWAGALVATRSCQTNYRKEYAELLVLHLLLLSNPLAHHRNVARLSLFYRYYFGRCSSELSKLIPFPFFKEGLLLILIDCMIFLSPFVDVAIMSMSIVSFLAQLDLGIICQQNAFL